ncbi:hypothetical protein ZIOFF_048069 [Zingiber officinale]|uniref:Uncharacterized protein n=1 Tax=Zingiber officinale TaxID=94328 RepID=A0A8J5FP31_ZINOF|nr:hypothetical protein ZIOFF_048069 [Zingiber officinale]
MVNLSNNPHHFNDHQPIVVIRIQMAYPQLWICNLDHAKSMTNCGNHQIGRLTGINNTSYLLIAGRMTTIGYASVGVGNQPYHDISRQRGGRMHCSLVEGVSLRSARAIEFFRKKNIVELDIGDYLAICAIFSAIDFVCILHDETPLLYSLVFGEGVVNDATSVVLFNAIQKFDLVLIEFTVVL